MNWAPWQRPPRAGPARAAADSDVVGRTIEDLPAHGADGRARGQRRSSRQVIGADKLGGFDWGAEPSREHAGGERKSDPYGGGGGGRALRPRPPPGAADEGRGPSPRQPPPAAGNAPPVLPSAPAAAPDSSVLTTVADLRAWAERRFDEEARARRHLETELQRAAVRAATAEATAEDATAAARRALAAASAAEDRLAAALAARGAIAAADGALTSPRPGGDAAPSAAATAAVAAAAARAQAAVLAAERAADAAETSARRSAEAARRGVEGETAASADAPALRRELEAVRRAVDDAAARADRSARDAGLAKATADKAASGAENAGRAAQEAMAAARSAAAHAEKAGGASGRSLADLSREVAELQARVDAVRQARYPASEQGAFRGARLLARLLRLLRLLPVAATRSEAEAAVKLAFRAAVVVAQCRPRAGFAAPTRLFPFSPPTAPRRPSRARVVPCLQSPGLLSGPALLCIAPQTEGLRRDDRAATQRAVDGLGAALRDSEAGLRASLADADDRSRAAAERLRERIEQLSALLSGQREAAAEGVASALAKERASIVRAAVDAAEAVSRRAAATIADNAQAAAASTVAQRLEADEAARSSKAAVAGGGRDGASRAGAEMVAAAAASAAAAAARAEAADRSAAEAIREAREGSAESERRLRAQLREVETRVEALDGLVESTRGAVSHAREESKTDAERRSKEVQRIYAELEAVRTGSADSRRVAEAEAGVAGLRRDLTAAGVWTRSALEEVAAMARRAEAAAAAASGGGALSGASAADGIVTVGSGAGQHPSAATLEAFRLGVAQKLAGLEAALRGEVSARVTGERALGDALTTAVEQERANGRRLRRRLRDFAGQVNASLTRVGELIDEAREEATSDEALRALSLHVDGEFAAVRELLGEEVQSLREALLSRAGGGGGGGGGIGSGSGGGAKDTGHEVTVRSGAAGGYANDVRAEGLRSLERRLRGEFGRALRSALSESSMAAAGSGASRREAAASAAASADTQAAVAMARRALEAAEAASGDARASRDEAERALATSRRAADEAEAVGSRIRTTEEEQADLRRRVRKRLELVERALRAVEATVEATGARLGHLRQSATSDVQSLREAMDRLALERSASRSTVTASGMPDQSVRSPLRAPTEQLDSPTKLQGVSVVSGLAGPASPAGEGQATLEDSAAGSPSSSAQVTEPRPSNAASLAEDATSREHAAATRITAAGRGMLVRKSLSSGKPARSGAR